MIMHSSVQGCKGILRGNRSRQKPSGWSVLKEKEEDMELYGSNDLAVRQRIRRSHETAIEVFAEPGTWLDSDSRLAILKEARNAGVCPLCLERKNAVSPYALEGNHQVVTNLSADLVEIVHRIVTDSGRLTKSWYQRVTNSAVTAEIYVEIVGLVATSIVIDSFGAALGADQAEPPVSQGGKPTLKSNDKVIDVGAWVPVLDLEQTETDLDIPAAPNIFRAMGLVPKAIEHFFGVMQSQYSLTKYEISLKRSQIEMLAARVSSLNQCFY